MKIIRNKLKRRKVSYNSVRNRLDSVFSKFVRLRDSDQYGNIWCITCWSKINWKLAHNCHFIERWCYKYRRDEDNCNAWCSWCNTYRKEKHKRLYTMCMIQKYGLVDVEEMFYEEKQIQKKPSILWLEEQIEYYSKKVVKMLLDYK